MNKNELRKIYKNIRNNIKDRNTQNEIIFNKLINLEENKNIDTILIYVSFNNEVDTLNIIKYFLKKKKIAVPKINSDEMDFYYIESLKDLSQGSFNILEPTTNNKVTNFNNSICIVPGLCFDKENYRLGYGKGYYDKFLSNKNIYTIGLSYKETIIKKLPIDKYDIKLDKVIQ